MIYRLIIGEILFNYAKIMKNQSFPKKLKRVCKSDIGVIIASKFQTYFSPIFTENQSLIVRLVGVTLFSS
jgi:hypothetical protein